MTVADAPLKMLGPRRTLHLPPIGRALTRPIARAQPLEHHSLHALLITCEQEVIDVDAIEPRHNRVRAAQVERFQDLSTRFVGFVDECSWSSRRTSNAAKVTRAAA